VHRFARSWSLFKSTLAVLNADKELLWFPILAGLVTIIASVVLFAVGATFAAFVGVLGGGASAATGGESGSPVGTLLIFAAMFLYALVMYFIGNYFMTGLAGAALMRFDGKDPTFRDGLRVANGRLGSIFGFSVIAATVGVVLSALRGRGGDGNVGGQIAAAIGGAAWSVVTFLVIPVIAATGAGAIDAIKQSGSLLRKTWGEQIIGSGGIGLVFALAILAEVALTGLLVVLVISSTAATIAVLILGVLGFVLLAVLNSALSGIYKAAVYEYAVSGEVVEQFDTMMIQGAFHAKVA
jgi:hypothetical protein